MTEGWFKRSLHHLVETWNRARNDSSNGELTSRQWGDYHKHHLTHGWWIDPHDWSLGISLTNDLQDPKHRLLYPGTLAFGIEVGPFDWHLTLNQPNYLRRQVGTVTDHEAHLPWWSRMLIPKPWIDPEDEIEERSMAERSQAYVDEISKKRERWLTEAAFRRPQ